MFWRVFQSILVKINSLCGRKLIQIYLRIGFFFFVIFTINKNFSTYIIIIMIIILVESKSSPSEFKVF